MASVSLRCHGLGAIGRWTVAADESRRAWVVPLFGAQGTSKTDAPELKLTTYEVATRLVAKKPAGPSQHACVLDLQDNSWTELLFPILSPMPGDADPGLYIIPATEQVLDRQGQPVPPQEQYQQWLVSGLDVWNDKGRLLQTALTVAEVTQLAQEAGANMPDSLAAAVEHDSSDLPSSSHAAAKRQATAVEMQQQPSAKRLKPKQHNQQQAVPAGSTPASTTQLPDPLHNLLAAESAFTPKVAEQLLQLALSSKYTLQHVLHYVRQQRGVPALLDTMGHVINRRKATMLLPALAADHGSLMAQLLQSLGSTHRQTAEQATDVLYNLSKAVAASQLMTVTVEADQGSELLCKALIDQHGLIPPCSVDGLRSDLRRVKNPCCEFRPQAYTSNAHHMVMHPVAKIVMAVSYESAPDHLHRILQRCHDLISSGSQRPRASCDCSTEAALLLVVCKRRWGSCGSDFVVKALEPLLAGASVVGPAQKQYLAALLAVLECSLPMDAGQHLLACDLTAIIQVMQQQDEAAELAASVIAGLVGSTDAHGYEFIGAQGLVPYTDQLAEILDSSSSSSSMWVRLCVLQVMLLIGVSPSCPEGFSAVLPHLDTVLEALAASTQQVLPAAATEQVLDMVAHQALAYFVRVTQHTDVEATLLASEGRIQVLGQFLGKMSACLLDPSNCMDKEAIAEAMVRIGSALVGHPEGTQLVAESMSVEVFTFALNDILPRTGENKWHWLLELSDPTELSVAALHALSLILQWVADQQPSPAPATALSAEECSVILEGYYTGQYTVVTLLVDVIEDPNLLDQGFRCLRWLSGLPWGVYQCSLGLKTWRVVLEAHETYMTTAEYQPLADDLAALEANIAVFGERLLASCTQAHSEMLKISGQCAQLHQQYREQQNSDELLQQLTGQLCQLASAETHERRLERMYNNLFLSYPPKSAQH